ncbi:(Fe-S)-binding protein [Alkalibacter mobilis]|uniref:(Fe-S)-binding protein n=1 Tax=Alkalibacter mobilis TaxID=2787712 RepID=UPI001CEC715D|nr:(Fe-S)-binding protein [Alkalibacter mobilis]
MKNIENLNIDEMDLYEIYNLLPKTNCRRCGYDTCLAFAAEVEKGTKQITACRVICGNS